MAKPMKSGVFLCILSIFSVVLLSTAGTAVEKSGKREEVVVAAIGDIVLGWHLDNIYLKLAGAGKDPFDFPFSGVSDVLEKADIAVGNLEAPFTKRGEKMEKKFNFRVDPEYVKCLKRGGVDVVNLANNHIMDYGGIGLMDTMETLGNAGIRYFGAGENLYEAREPVIIEANGLKVAFIGFSNTFPMEMNATKRKPGVVFGYPGYIKYDVKKAKENADFVVVSFHWGSEKSHRIKSYQKEYARLAVDSGADVVLGHHPHVLQGVETYRGKVIAYSLGNFVFGANWTGDIKETMILFIRLGREGITHRIVPVDIASVLFQPRIMEGEEGKNLVEKIKGYSVTPIEE